MRREDMRWGWGALGLAMSILAGCTENSEPAPASLSQSGNAIPPLEQTAKDPCADPTSTDCPCVQEGSQIDCGSVHEMRGDYVICSLGVRTCTGGLWSECEAQQLTMEQAAAQKTTTDGLRLMALSAGANCNNLCDPQCIAMSDTATGLTVSDDLQADSDGLTLPKVGSGGHCSSLTISPASATINITAIATNGAVTASPASVAFSATCSTGVPVQPSWTIDSYDRAQINASGTLTVFSGIGSSILVTATSSQDTKTALVSVKTSIDVNGTASPTIVTAFGTAGTLTDATAKTLYPYKNTVFPLDLKAPLVQYDTGGTAATEVQVGLRFPAGSATPSFWYGKIYTTGDPQEGTLFPSSAPAWQIPQEIWSAFDRSAAGSATGGEIVIQRRVSGTVRPELKIPVKFASQPLYGTVYYTQYARTLAACSGNESCSYSSGSYYSQLAAGTAQTCQVGIVTHPSGSNTSMIRAIDLSQKSAPNSDPYGGTAACPVCHSVSPNGGVFVSGNQYWQGTSGSKGVNNIGLSATGYPTFASFGAPDNGLAPTYTGLSDTGTSNAAGDPYSGYERTGENSRGFAYAPINYDGSMVMQGPTFWGSTLEYGASNNAQSAAMTGLAGYVKPYFFVKTAQPGLGVQLATTGALSYTNPSTGTLQGSTSGLAIDGVTLAVGQSVLVKDETGANKKYNGVYAVSATSPWQLKRRNDADTNGELTGGQEVRVSDGTANHGDVFYISTPAASSTTININTDAITFSPRVYPGSAFGSSPFTVQYGTTAALAANTQSIVAIPATLTATANGALGAIDGVTVGVNDSILVQDEASSSKNGIYQVVSIGGASAKWQLKRRSDAMATGQLNPLQEIKVTGGTSNGGKVFYVSSPAPGSSIVMTTILNTGTSYTETTQPTMMVPVFSPNGSKIVYVNGDADSTYGLADTGWRRGLTMLSFDATTMALSSKVRLVNNWNSVTAGVPVKWPFFEGDSRSLLYVQTETTEYCSSALSNHGVTVNNADGRGCFEGSYGSMSPTTRGRWKGAIYSVDTQNPSTTQTELKKLNDGDDDLGVDDATDADRSYQPTVLPLSVGGYRWVIFTSPRPYGNQFNQKGTDFSCSASMLWMSAIDDVTASIGDRSHPAFLVPGQNIAKITTAGHYVNERGYLVPTPCKGAGVSCSADEQCCGGTATPATAACRAPTSWTPASGTPAKTCASLSGTCSNTGGSCASPADCCNTTDCINFACAALPSYTEATFDRDYTATCATGYQPNWQLFSYYLTTGNGSSITFTAKSATTAAALATSPSLAIGTSTATVVSPATPAFFDVGAVLNTNHVNGRNYLRITVDLIPSADGQTAPVLHDWEMRYTCVAAQ